MKLNIVVPCFNEEEVLDETGNRLTILLKDLLSRNKISQQSCVIFVDDGSKDQTWKVIEKLASSSDFLKGVKLSRNRGHQIALLAGLFSADGEVVISIDADLQDDLGAIESMLDAYNSGSDIVYGVRKRRDKDSFFKKFSAESYYRLLNWMGVDVIFNHADYRLLSQRALSALKQFGEANLFLRGIVPLLGYSSSIVYYDRAERFAGESKYPLKKMLAFAWQGITSFSASPLRLVTLIGFVIFVISLSITFWAIWVKLFSNEAIPGWTSTVVPIYLMGGMQMLGIGIIGEYIAKIYLETKRRPMYFIEVKTDNFKT